MIFTRIALCAHRWSNLLGMLLILTVCWPVGFWISLNFFTFFAEGESTQGLIQAFIYDMAWHLAWHRLQGYRRKKTPLQFHFWHEHFIPMYIQYSSMRPCAIPRLRRAYAVANPLPILDSCSVRHFSNSSKTITFAMHIYTILSVSRLKWKNWTPRKSFACFGPCSTFPCEIFGGDKCRNG